MSDFREWPQNRSQISKAAMDSIIAGTIYRANWKTY